jgi:Ca2+/Na+ antiporter
LTENVYVQVLKGIALGFVGIFLFVALPALVVAFTLNSTFLNPQFVNREIQNLDIPAVVRETLTDQASSLDPTFIADIDQTIIQIKPWMDKQIQVVINSSYDYLLGKTNELNISIPTGEIKQTVLDSLTTIYLKDPPAEYMSLPVSQRTQYVADLQKQFLDAFPTSIDINAETIGNDDMQSIQQVRDVVGYVRLAYFGLIGLCVLLILLIILILRDLKAIARTFGLVFLIAGLPLTAVFFILKLVVPGLISTGDLPAHVQTWIPQVINDFLSPFGIFSISVFATGIILLAVSFFVKRKNPPVVEGQRIL